MSDVSRRILAPLACAAMLLGGCVADKQQRRPPRAPADLRAETITIATAAHALLDEDNNGYPDTIPVIVYFWDPRYPLPLWDDGVMRFELHDDSGSLLAEWDVPQEVVEASRRRDQVGAVHLLTLDIRDATTDVRPSLKALLSAQFLAVDGHVARTARPLALRLGA